jgi:modulator of FtsH protease HflK
MIERNDAQHTFRHARTVGAGLAGIALLLYAASGLYVIEPEQNGVVIRFGKIIDDAVAPGIHYHWPWPIEHVERPRSTELRRLEIPFLQTQGDQEGEGELLTGDENLVRARLLLQYTIAQPKDYLTSTPDPDAILARVARSDSIGFFAALPVDAALTTGRESIQQHLRRSIQKRADDYRLGIRLASVQLQSIDPPDSAGIAEAFKAVSSAREERHKLVEQAEGERNRRLPEARAEAQRRLRDGEAHANEVVERAKGDSERFLSMWSAYDKARSVTAHRLYTETMESILPKVKLLIMNPNAEGRPAR